MAVPDASPLPLPRTRLVNFNQLWLVAGALIVMGAAIRSGDLWFLNFVHVLAGLMWTGIDLFMGFVIGPIMRQLDLPARRQMITRLMPRMIFLMPTLATVTATAGSALASQLGFYDLAYPQKAWVVGALAVIAILTIQGVGVLTPINILVCLEVQKEHPDFTKLERLMRIFIRATAFQGAMQVAIIVIMARFVTGL
jgi:uncharacterized membrane protein